MVRKYHYYYKLKSLISMYLILILEVDNVPNPSTSNVDTLNVIQKAFGVRSSFSLREMMRRASAAVSRSSMLFTQQMTIFYTTHVVLTNS